MTNLTTALWVSLVTVALEITNYQSLTVHQSESIPWKADSGDARKHMLSPQLWNFPESLGSSGSNWVPFLAEHLWHPAWKAGGGNTIDKRHWLCTDEGTTPASGILFYCLETDSGTTFVKSQAVRAAQPSSFTCELIQSAETQWVSHPKVHLGCKIASWMGGSEKTTLPHTFKFTPTKAKGWMQKQPVIPLFGFWYLQMILLCKFTLKKKNQKACVCTVQTPVVFVFELGILTWHLNWILFRI